MTGYKLKCLKGIIDTGPFKCDGQWHVLSRKNETEKTARIRKIQIWLGMAQGGIADFAVELVRLSKGGYYIEHYGHTNWDHYHPPTHPQHCYTLGFAPDWMELGPDEIIQLRYAGFPFPPSTEELEGHVVVTVWIIDE